ncbi:MAG: GNAT family N-acetyltransferase [bacterium]|nr:GNAT family N-acetyltransferase [bacterium]
MSRTLRAFDVSDLAAVSRICHDALSLDLDASSIPEILLRQPRVGVVSMAGSRIAGVCLVSEDASPEAAIGYVDLIAVSPGEQRGGRGRALLAAGESMLARLGHTQVRVRGNPPHYAWPGVDTNYVAAVALFDSSDYRRQTTERNMRVDLRAAPLDTVDDELRLSRLGISCRRAETDESAWIARQLATAWSPSVVNEVAAALGGEHGGVHIAIREERCVGFCAYGVTWPLDVGPLGTNADVRNLGLGATLIRRCLQDQRDTGLGHAEIQWAGPVRWLEQTLNAATSRTFHTYSKHLSV